MTIRADDEIIEDLRQFRQAHAEALDYDLKRITEDLQCRERESEEPVVDLRLARRRSCPTGHRPNTPLQPTALRAAAERQSAGQADEL